MRNRLRKALLAVPVAVFAGVGPLAGPALAAPAAPAAGAQGPALGPVVANFVHGGYQMSGRQFRWISATIMVPQAFSSQTRTCVINTPSFDVTLSGVEEPTLPWLITITDTTTSTALTEGADYTQTATGTNTFHEVMIHTSNWAPGDTLTVTATDSGNPPSTAMVTLSNGLHGTIDIPTHTRFVAENPPTCVVGSFTPTPTLVYDGSTLLVPGTDYTWVGGLTGLLNPNPASFVWAYGDTLRLIYRIYHTAYVQLSNGSLGDRGGQYARTGIEPCAVAQHLAYYNGTCTPGSWVAFMETWRNSASGFPEFSHYFPITVNQGDGVAVHIYYSQGGDELFFGITPPGGTAVEYQTGGHGAIFNYAAALVDFTDAGGLPVPLPVWAPPIRIETFAQGAVTTYGGSKGSFIGPWTTSPVAATTNGLPFPQGTTRVAPSPLISDGLVANGAVRPWDAFAVFMR